MSDVPTPTGEPAKNAQEKGWYWYDTRNGPPSRVTPERAERLRKIGEKVLLQHPSEIAVMERTRSKVKLELE